MTIEHLLTVARLRALSRPTKSPEDLVRLLDELARTLGESLGYGTVAVTVLRPAWDDFEVAAVHGSTEVREALLGRRSSREDWVPLLDERFARRGAYLIPHGEIDWREGSVAYYIPELEPAAEEDAWHPEDALLVPLESVDGSLIGVLSVDEPESGRRPTDEELEVLVVVAGHAARVAEDARDAALAARHRDALEQLLEISAHLADDRLSLSELLGAVCGGIASALRFEKVSLQLFDHEVGGFVAGATAGWQAGEVGVECSLGPEDVERLLDPEFEVAGCYVLPREVAEARVPVGGTTYVSQRNGRGPHAWQRHWLVVPLRAPDGALVGFIWPDDPEDRLLPSRDRLQVLRTFANQASSALAGAGRRDELVSSEARKAAVLDATPDCVLTLDGGGTVLEANAAAEVVLGIPMSELVGRRLLEVIIPEGDRADLGRWLRGGESTVLGSRIEITALRSDGTPFPAEFALTPVRAPGPPLMTATLRDVTKRKASQERLLETERKYRGLIEGLPLATYINDLGATIRTSYMSPQIEPILGYAPEEWLVDDFYPTLLHPDDRERVLDEVACTHASGQPFRSEYRLIAKDGRSVWILDETRAVLDEEYRPLFLQGYLLDISERKELEEQLRQSHKLEAVGQFAGGIAHDFNNVLLAIRAYSDLALRRLTDDADPLLERDLAEIAAAAQRASGLTRQLLAFSRRQVLAPADIDVNLVIEETHDMLGRLLGEQVELVADLDAGTGAIRADRTQIEQVLVNLVVNGRDAMPGGGTLRVETWNETVADSPGAMLFGASPGEYVVISVRDEGRGMDEATQARVFEPFFTTKGEEGSGLGLSTVYGIVKQSGGFVEIETAPGEGTTFRVHLPRLAARSAAVAA